VEVYITESGNRIRKMAKDTSVRHMAMNIGESSRMIINGERESQKKREYYTETNAKKISASAGLEYSEVLDF
jgi:hypothetical protein